MILLKGSLPLLITSIYDKLVPFFLDQMAGDEVIRHPFLSYDIIRVTTCIELARNDFSHTSSYNNIQLI